MVLGERILDREERPIYRFKELRDDLELPRVGERVRSKTHGTVWKIIEEKEIWLDIPAEGVPSGNGEQLYPAIQIRYWKEDTSNGPGTGRTLFYRYSQIDPSFHKFWEVLYDW
jgi:hypothetical protein